MTKDAARFPTWTALRTSREEENERFLASVLFDGAGSVESLFTARHTFVDATLAQLYGLPPVTGWQRVRRRTRTSFRPTSSPACRPGSASPSTRRTPSVLAVTS